jgi:hypothetical protein
MRETEIEDWPIVVGEVIRWSGGYFTDQTPSINFYKHTSRKSLVGVSGGFGRRNSLHGEFEIVVTPPTNVEVVAVE